MGFDPYEIDLPVREIIPEVLKKASSDNTLIINAPAGAGKSTLLPLALLDEPWLNQKRILMLEPRRLAARAIAERMAFFLGEPVGQTVGYRIRFENRVSDATRIEVITEGILTRMLQSDNELKDVAMVIFDEFHERSIHADVALALCRESQQVLRPDLRIMIMSATLNMPQLSRMLTSEPIVSEGRIFPVEVFYAGDTEEITLIDQCNRIVKKAVKEHQGDALVFLPGEREIRGVQESLRKQLSGFAVMPLYGSMPINQQHAALFPHKEGKRKIVLATSIAETSLTIEGIKIVIDSGFGRTSRFDAKSGLSRLQTIRISKDSAEQRKGRAGRLSPGVCYRMWSQVTHDRLDDHLTPEIVETDLASLALDMAQWGVLDMEQLMWLTPPPKGTMMQAKELLYDLEALKDGQITDHGRNIHSLPCHPRIAHMLLLAEEEDQLSLAADIAALLEERDPLGKEAGIDINERISALRKFRNEGRSGGRMERIKKISRSYLELFDQEVSNEAVDPYETGVLLSYAYPERIAHARPGNNAQFKLSNGRIAMAGHKDDLAYEPWLAIAHMDAREGMGKIFLASPLNPKDLAPLVKEKEVIRWDTDDGGLTASKELRIGNIVLQSKPMPDPDPKYRIQAICDAIRKEGAHLLNFDDQVEQLQNRILSLRRWDPVGKWPDYSTSTLITTNSQWLAPYLNDIRTPVQLKKLNLYRILKDGLDYETQELMDRLAPDQLLVPSGSKIKIQYRSDGMPPVVAVRIQEVFGMSTSPMVNGGTQKVLLHLLSPGFKPVQITDDLDSFWKSTYFEVRKELKGRYPKHSWPEDPFTEPARQGVKRGK